MQYALEKRRQKQASRPAVSQTDVRRQLAWASGSEQFDHRDPLYHVTESFQQTFDEIGRRHAAQLAGETVGGFAQPVEDAQTSEGQGQPGGLTQERQTPDPTSAKAFYQMRYPENQDMVRRFSETAFQRGTMAGAVMAGTGKMMLVSCLKRTVGQSQPVKEQQRRLFEGGSQQRMVPGHAPDNVIFNRGFADSAVGLVVDTLRDARRTVESMADLAAGKSDMGREGGAQTLQKMYPFLDDHRERMLIEQYGARLRESDDSGERQLLQNAYVHAQALLNRKAQMRNEFINKLRFVADRATEALTLFEAPGFAEEVARELEQSEQPPEPPDLPEDGAPEPPDEPAEEAPKPSEKQEDGHATD